MVWRWTLMAGKKRDGFSNYDPDSQMDSDLNDPNDPTNIILRQLEEQRAKQQAQNVVPQNPTALPAALPQPAGQPQSAPDAMSPEDDRSGRQRAKDDRQQLVDKHQSQLMAIQNKLIPDRKINQFNAIWRDKIDQNPNLATGISQVLFDASGKHSFVDFLSRASTYQPTKSFVVNDGTTLSGGYDLLPPDLKIAPPGEEMRKAILQELATAQPNESKYIAALGNILSDPNNQQAEKFFMEGAGKQMTNRGGTGVQLSALDGGDSGRSSGGADTSGKFSTKPGGHREEFGRQMSEDIRNGLLESVPAFFENPRNLAFFDEVKRSVPDFDEQKMGHKKEQIILSTLTDSDVEGQIDDGKPAYRWERFFEQNPQLLGARSGDEALAMIVPGLSPEIEAQPERALQMFQKLLAEGDPRLQEFLRPSLQSNIQRATERKLIDFYQDWGAIVKDMRRASNLVRAGLMRTFKREKDMGYNSVTQGRRYYFVKHKFKTGIDALSSVVDKGQSFLVSDAGEPDMELIRTSKGKLGLRMEGGQIKEISPNDIADISGIVSPKKFVTPALLDMKVHNPELLLRDFFVSGQKYANKQPEEVNAERANLLAAWKAKNPTKDESQFKSTIPSDVELNALRAHNQYIEQNQPSGDEKSMLAFDRLKGYRGWLAKSVAETMQKTGSTLETVSQKMVKAKAKSPWHNNPSVWVQQVLNGEPVPYNYDAMKTLGAAMGVPVASFFSEPPEFDENNADDVYNVSESIPTAFQDYGPYLVHRKRQATANGGYFPSTTTMAAMLEMARLHTIFFNKPKSDRTGGDSRQWGHLALELADRPISIFEEDGEKYDPQKKKNVKVHRPLTREEGEERLRGSKPADIYDGNLGLRKLKEHTYEPDGVDETGRPVMKEDVLEPDPFDFAGGLGVDGYDPQAPGIKDKPKKEQLKRREQVDRLYHILEDPSSSHEDKEQAAKAIEKVHKDIRSKPVKERTHFPYYKYRYRPVYDEHGNRLPAKKQDVVYGLFIRAMNELDRLETLRFRMLKTASVGTIDSYMDKVADETIWLISAFSE